MDGVQSGGLPNVNPVLLIGVGICVLPFFGPVLGMKIDIYWFYVGLVTCLIGGILETFRDEEPKYPRY